jgi:hypothetical protein
MEKVRLTVPQRRRQHDDYDGGERENLVAELREQWPQTVCWPPRPLQVGIDQDIEIRWTSPAHLSAGSPLSGISAAVGMAGNPAL